MWTTLTLCTSLVLKATLLAYIVQSSKHFVLCLLLLKYTLCVFQISKHCIVMYSGSPSWLILFAYSFTAVLNYMIFICIQHAATKFVFHRHLSVSQHGEKSHCVWIKIDCYSFEQWTNPPGCTVPHGTKSKSYWWTPEFQDVLFIINISIIVKNQIIIRWHCWKQFCLLRQMLL